MATTRATAAAHRATRANPMDVFVWEGTDKRGTKMKGESPSKSANLVRAELRKQGINPTVVKEKTKPLFGAAGKRISALEIAIFSRQIATMLQSGVPMVQSFEILSQGQKNERMRVMLIGHPRLDLRRLDPVRVARPPPAPVRRPVPQPGARPAKAPACSTPCSTPWPPTRNASRP